MISLSKVVNTTTKVDWRVDAIKSQPLKYTCVVALLLVRSFYGFLFISFSIRKLFSGWLTSDFLEQEFISRSAYHGPGNAAHFYLENFAIPLYAVIAFIIVLGQFLIGVSLVTGIAVRAFSLFTFFMMVNFAIGGFFFPQALPYYLLPLLFFYFPTSHWLGFDKRLSHKFPGNIFFR